MPTPASRRAVGGLLACAVLVALAFGRAAAARLGRPAPRCDPVLPVPPLHGLWRRGRRPRPPCRRCCSPLLALVAGGRRLADRLPWRRLLLASYVAALAWLLSLALVDGPTAG